MKADPRQSKYASILSLHGSIAAALTMAPLGVELSMISSIFVDLFVRMYRLAGVCNHNNIYDED